jgi:zinc protease
MVFTSRPTSTRVDARRPFGKYAREARRAGVRSQRPREPPVTSPRTVVATFPEARAGEAGARVPVDSADHPDLFAMDLLATVLGSGESSILVEELRDKRSSSARSRRSDDADLRRRHVRVDMELDPDKVAEATAPCWNARNGEEGRRQRRALTPRKTQMRVARVQALQTSEEVAASMVEDFLSTGDPHFSDRYVAKIAEVTNDQIKDVAQPYFDQQRC